MQCNGTYTNYVHIYIYTDIFCFVVPTPNVTITVLSDQSTFLSLRCDATTVMGISSSVDIVWMKDDTEILRENDAEGDPINNATVMLYTSHYYNNVTMTDDNTTYHCQAIINTSPTVKSSDNYNLHVIGECSTSHIKVIVTI